LCEDAHVLIARRLTVALLLAGFRMWRRLPPDERRRVVDAVRRHGPRVASSLSVVRKIRIRSRGF
jgi:hypothetical protein